MSVVLFVLLFLQSNEQVFIETGGYPPLIAPSLEISGSLELLDDFDKNPCKPEDNWFGMDKFWHWAMAFTLTGSSYHFIHNQLHSPDPGAMIMSISSVLSFSVLKEFYDLATYNLFSYKDICYDVLGIITGYIVFIWDWNV